MDSLVERNISFFDRVSLFCDFWQKNSALNISFVFSSDPNNTKAILWLPSDNHDQDQLAVFKHHLLRHFQLDFAASKIIFSQTCVEILIHDGPNQDVGTIS